MAAVKSEKLFDLMLFGRPNMVGKTPYGGRRIVQITGGSFDGPKLKGELLPVGADIALIREDGVFEPRVNALLQTNDDALIHMIYQGRFHANESVMKRLINRDPGVSRDDFYLWNAVFFETAAERYLWLNKILAISTGMPQPKSELGIGMLYEVFELL
jgi:hypothetical protein